MHNLQSAIRDPHPLRCRAACAKTAACSAALFAGQIRAAERPEGYTLETGYRTTTAEPLAVTRDALTITAQGTDVDVTSLG